jgi:hypothetical protein
VRLSLGAYSRRTGAVEVAVAVGGGLAGTHPVRMIAVAATTRAERAVRNTMSLVGVG